MPASDKPAKNNKSGETIKLVKGKQMPNGKPQFEATVAASDESVYIKRGWRKP